jgi:type IV pilus assembly protein PilW
MNRHQQGYTLVELMISMLLGLMLISGFGSLFVQSQKNSTTQRSLSYMMEDGRYVLEVFGKELRRAGFLRNKLNITGGGGANDVFTADANVLGSSMSFAAGEYIKGEYDADGFGAAADLPYNINRLTLRYQLNNSIDPITGKSAELASGDPSSTNSACEGNVLLTPAEDTATNQIHVVTLYFYVAFDATTDAPVLYCLAKRQNLTDPTKDKTPPAVKAQPLISNVQKLVITYGIDPDGNGAANYYLRADSVTDWQQVVAAKLSVVLRSEDDNLTQNVVNYDIDGDPNSPYTATDKRLYRVSSSTIAFRNKIL